MKSLIGLMVLGLMLGCGKKDNTEQKVNEIVYRETTVTKGLKTEIEVNTCEEIGGYGTCSCLDRLGYESCKMYESEASQRWEDCITPYLESGYRSYCTINKMNSRGVQR